uniref:Transmembrane protein n=1 Tax=Fagus sylvatica TaxID=28930 RepID=A0A2N9HIQ0_FAGSY
MIFSSSPGISSCTLIHAPVCCRIDLMMLPDFPITLLAFMSWQSMQYVVVTVSDESMEFENLGFEFEDLGLGLGFEDVGLGFEFEERCGFQRAVDLGFGVWVLVAMVVYVSVVLVD